VSQGYAGDLTPRQAWERLAHDDAAMLVDVRTEAEWAYVGVPDTTDLGREVVLVQWQRFPDGARNPDFLGQLRAAGARDDTPLIFLCRSGVRSVAAARAAAAAGMTASYNVLEGFEGGLDGDGHRGRDGWRAEGLPWRQQ
jgi:rhodanese-related sulfurtransferase